MEGEGEFDGVLDAEGEFDGVLDAKAVAELDGVTDGEPVLEGVSGGVTDADAEIEAVADEERVLDEVAFAVAVIDEDSDAPSRARAPSASGGAKGAHRACTRFMRGPVLRVCVTARAKHHTALPPWNATRSPTSLCARRKRQTPVKAAAN